MISHRTILRKESLEGRNWSGAYHRFVIIGGLCHKEVKAEWREDLDMTSFKTCPQDFFPISTAELGLLFLSLHFSPLLIFLWCFVASLVLGQFSGWPWPRGESAALRVLHLLIHRCGFHDFPPNRSCLQVFVLSEPSILISHPNLHFEISAAGFLKQHPDVGWYTWKARSFLRVRSLILSYDKCPFW